MGGGLQFTRNWFKKEVPHHLASHCEAFFFSITLSLLQDIDL